MNHNPSEGAPLRAASTCSTSNASNQAAAPDVRAGRLQPMGTELFEARDAHGHRVFVYDAARGVVQTRRKGVLSEFRLPS